MGRRFKSPSRLSPPRNYADSLTPLRDYAILRILQFCTVGNTLLIACPHWQFVAEKCDCRRCLAVFCDSRTFLQQSHLSATVWTGLNKEPNSYFVVGVITVHRDRFHFVLWNIAPWQDEAVPSFRNGSAVDSRDAVCVVGRWSTDTGDDRDGTSRVASRRRRSESIHSFTYHGWVSACRVTWPTKPRCNRIDSAHSHSSLGPGCRCGLPTFVLYNYT